MKNVTHWIDGARVEGTGRTGEIYNPATGEVAGHVRLASAAEVDAAVAAAAAAFPAWRDASLVKRSQVLFRFRELLHAHRDELAALISAEHGKVHSDALGEVARGLEVVEFACGIAHLLKGGYSEGVSTRVDSYSIRQPLGVVAGITPFNFPAMVPMWMFPVAIACGNAFVLKPSERDPSASLLMAELWQRAGLPDGVFNVVQGDKAAVDRLLEHPDVRAVSFVGSTPIARYVYETGTAHGKRVQALGGAKNHMLVLPDADLDLVADAAVSAGFGSAGERCMAISVVLAVDPVGDELVDKIVSRVSALTVGPGDDPASEMGPLVTAAHRDKVASYLDAGVAEGAKLVVDGRLTPVRGGAAAADTPGFWLGPTVLDHVPAGSRVHTEEIFGPVLAIVRVASYEEGLELINGGAFGNGTAIFTNDGGAARRFQNEVEVGMVGINVPIPVPMAFYSFGGWKDSLFGDTHVHGTEGVHFYTRGKVVTSRWLDPSHGGVNLGFPTNK
ncbi:malonate-semialdehyde dehydrogenase (acetylating)/methylmalonate-semialdehyde dehydrogenase [Streptosporangium becharense]|uniref:methylmalonate-semialdehyde dehydrogenase (CoA acylating) n=1 Tax=Streptosporangium becharense TaxID=1816182 RepID=A0A7W9MG23_9ACTN|nr:CoA-acylating methylmalonate-semialdehyde dehydrogenase [Streptosporangium becharense]MBB2915565.1 malonate-semialdehyde dehydrogenase (acetylating)/methylmalonate-semialdehyde dehydrogenase [Streptosporangium becharense]MBB5818908.1 malonate-semialdehyde dehydrogenase (acetylating)/methylmalonate-semialdehyde dehydrogenase [Streptosporangium becharense]